VYIPCVWVSVYVYMLTYNSWINGQREREKKPNLFRWRSNNMETRRGAEKGIKFHALPQRGWHCTDRLNAIDTHTHTHTHKHTLESSSSREIYKAETDSHFCVFLLLFSDISWTRFVCVCFLCWPFCWCPQERSAGALTMLHLTRLI
jgi:hypothetical protein